MGEPRGLSPGRLAQPWSLRSRLLAVAMMATLTACSTTTPDAASQADLTLADTAAASPAAAGSDTPQLSSEPGAVPGDEGTAGSADPSADPSAVPNVTTPSAGTPSASSPPAAPSSAGRTTPPTGPPKLAAASTTKAAAAATPAPKKAPSMAAPASPAAPGPDDEAAAAVAGSAGVGSGSGGALLTLGPGTPSAAEAQVIKLVNLERTVAGCAPLTANPVLIQVARAHSQEMSNPGAFRHNSIDGRTPFQRLKAVGYDYSIATENIAAGQPNASAVMAAWLVSAEHKANMLDCRFTEIGVGVVNVPGSQYGTYWTQDIATPM